jgi:hypothetical protein
VYSPRKYFSVVKFKPTGSNVDDMISTNTWTKNGTLNFTQSSKFNALKYETRSCLRYELKQAGYIQNTAGFTIGNEYSVSFWFKVDRELLIHHYDYFNSTKTPVPLISWGSNTKISTFEQTGIEYMPYGMKFVMGGTSIIIPYDPLELLDEWFHVLINKDTSNKFRIFINGIKYCERPANFTIEPFTNIKIGNPSNNTFTHDNPIYVYIDEISICNSCITIDQFWPFPKYLIGLYPSVDVKDLKKRQLPAGKTRYDICNDAVMITRSRHFKHSHEWKDNMVTKYRFDRKEPYASSFYESWMDNLDRPGDEYKKQ